MMMQTQVATASLELDITSTYCLVHGSDAWPASTLSCAGYCLAT